jgi:SWI/SNF-related matrix-associated actin-dependent regulator 1 of chromatin subfamily A
MLYLDLPSKFTKEYRTAERNLIQQLRNFKQDPNLQKTDLLATLTALRHLVGLAKVENACEFIRTFADSGDKLVVYGHHHDVLDSIEATLKQENIKFVRADGKTKNEDRQKRIDIFQDDPECTIFLATTAMGMGITLTAASNSLFVERQWSPAMEEQMEDRLHRIGQKRGVIAWYLQVENTVDERMAKIVSEKRSVLEQILDANEEEILERSVVNEILETYSD